jgi:hypothetical protein
MIYEEQMKLEIFEYIKFWYKKTKHSALDYLIILKNLTVKLITNVS